MSARSCRDVRADLSAYLDGDLDAGLTGETRAHLEGCADCRAELELLRLAVGALHRLPDLPPPAGILTGVRARLRPEPWYRRLLDHRQWLLGVPIGAVATVLVIIGISLFQARYPDIEKMDDRRAKGTLDSASIPQGASRGGNIVAPESSSVIGADKKARNHATPAGPAESVGPSKRIILESKIAKSQPAQPEPPIAPRKDTLREESPRGEQRAAAPSRTVTGNEYFSEQPSNVRTSRNREYAALDELDKKAGAISEAPVKKKESPAPFAQDVDRGASLGSASRVGEKEIASTRGTRFVCLLSPDGDTVDDLTRFLRRQGAVDIKVSELEPQAVRETFAPYRRRIGSLSEPSRGWTVTVSVPSNSRARLLEALSNLPGLRILEQPATLTAPEAPTESIGLRIMVFQ